MKTPVVIVTAALAAATLLAASSAGQLEVQTVASGLVHPWALAFLPDGRMLVTERPGHMRIVTREGQLSPPLKGVPEVWASGQGGLLDVVLDLVRERFGTAAITRAVLLGRSPGITMPMLPD